MTTPEEPNGPKNQFLFFLMAWGLLAVGFIINPFVKLKAWLKGERE